MRELLLVDLVRRNTTQGMTTITRIHMYNVHIRLIAGCS